MRDAGRFGMKNRGTDANEGDGHEDERKVGRDRKQDQASQRRSHAEREREGLRMFVGERADKRLEQRRGELVRQGNQSDVAVIQAQLRFQDRINSRDQRLKRVVDEMGEAEREKNAEHGRTWNAARLDVFVHAGRRAVRWRFARWAHPGTVKRES